MKPVLFLLIFLSFPIFAQRAAEGRSPVRETNQQNFDNWAANYLSETEMAEPIPLRTGRAIKRMYRLATWEDTDLGPAFEPEKRILEDPDRPFWALCGSTCRLYRAILETYGYTVEMVSIWQRSAPYPHTSHEVVRFAGPGETEFRFFDPLYGVALVNEAGDWVGVKEILQDLTSPSPQLRALSIEPYSEALAAGLQNINNLDYQKSLYPDFYNALVFRARDDSTWVINILNTSLVDPSLIRQTFETAKRRTTILVKY